MNNLKLAFVLGLGFLLSIGCTNSASEDFEEINGQFKKKRLKTISMLDKGATSGVVTTSFTYDSKNKLVSVSGTENTNTETINYSNNGNTIEASNGSSTPENFSIEQLYKSPYEVFKNGEVLEYDSNKNPSKVLFKHNVYHANSGTYSVENHTAEIKYDDKPNLFFSTLEAAGIIEILDGVGLQIGVNFQPTEVIKARALLPVNNLTKVVYKDADNKILGSLNIEYTYDTDGYPIKGIGVATNQSESINVEATYSYHN
ncbi:hypothetical protein [uncultured Tenacibaculum sp.]|uniref:hypothetical protein n=1 Tax=uncultured Tenacibaculum sp. TaxID=174713 RepID=UPI002608ADAF|nr:hypothetical protein [uncultured Tenacibaculum sp.]